MPSRDTKQGDFIRTNFRTVWPAHLSGFTRLLVQLRKRFDGDLDLALVLAVIGSRTQPDRWTPELSTFARLTTGEDPDATQFPINIQSVADYSGIPRETVRRKVSVLQDKGWIKRDEDGHLVVTREAASDLEDATSDTIAYLARLLMAFEAAQSNGACSELQ